MNLENITINTHSSIRIAGSKNIDFDPFKIEEEPHDADVIFITHDHFDHLDPDSVARVMKDDTLLVVPAGIREAAAAAAPGHEIMAVTPGESGKARDLRFTAVCAYNKLKPFHPKRNGWVGYVVCLDDTTYYVAGDTDAVKELESIHCDVALVPIGGKYTMNAAQAASLVNYIRPRAAIPTHYGSVVGSPEDAKTFGREVDPGIQVEYRI